MRYSVSNLANITKHNQRSEVRLSEASPARLTLQSRVFVAWCHEFWKRVINKYLAHCKVQSNILLSKIWGFHGGDYEEWRLLGCYALWLMYETTFRRNLSPTLSGCRRFLQKPHGVTSQKTPFFGLSLLIFCPDYCQSKLMKWDRSWNQRTNLLEVLICRPEMNWKLVSSELSVGQTGCCLHFGPTCLDYVRFEVFTAVTMKNDVFWDVPPCGSCKNRRFGGTWRLLHQGDKNRWTRNNTSCN
jgi:hypothetical protein